MDQSHAPPRTFSRRPGGEPASRASWRPQERAAGARAACPRTTPPAMQTVLRRATTHRQSHPLRVLPPARHFMKIITHPTPVRRLWRMPRFSLIYEYQVQPAAASQATKIAGPTGGFQRARPCCQTPILTRLRLCDYSIPCGATTCLLYRVLGRTSACPCPTTWATSSSRGLRASRSATLALASLD